MDVVKISDNEIYAFLLSQKAKIIQDANDYLLKRQAELDEVLEV